MPRRRKGEEVVENQGTFGWLDPAGLLASAPEGEVLYEAPELRKRAPRKAPEKKKSTLGLPFGTREADGHHVCWSCGTELEETEVMRAGPGDVRCPGCGAKLPFF